MTSIDRLHHCRSLSVLKREVKEIEKNTSQSIDVVSTYLLMLNITIACTPFVSFILKKCIFKKAHPHIMHARKYAVRMCVYAGINDDVKRLKISTNARTCVCVLLVILSSAVYFATQGLMKDGGTLKEIGCRTSLSSYHVRLLSARKQKEKKTVNIVISLL
jgi:hypothetical protein